MGIELDDQISIAVGSVGIYFTILKINECQKLINKYLNETDAGFPIFDAVCSLSVACNSLSYKFKAMLFSRDEYAITSNENYSVFKVLRKEKYFYKILWKSNFFDVTITENNKFFQIKINQVYTVDIQILENYTGPCSEIPFSADNTSTENLNSVLEKCISNLNNILRGYVLPESYFSSNLTKELDILFNILRDPLLPALQFQNLLDNSSCAIPVNLLNELHQVIAQYTSNYSSVFSRFPSTKIFSLVNKFLDSIGDQNTKYNMGSILRPIMELAEMFSSGMRGNAKYIIEGLLDEYRKVEVKFQILEDITHVNTTSQPITVSDVFSHNCLQKKNELILNLIENLEKYLPGLINDLKPNIHKLLNSLSGRTYSRVIAKLREILITGQVPSYEVRKNEIESIFLNSINRYSNSLSTGRLESLIYSNTEMFDIISDFFYHKMVDFRKCALEVYIRRAYMDYEIKSFKQSQLCSGNLCVIFQFTRCNSNTVEKFLRNMRKPDFAMVIIYFFQTENEMKSFIQNVITEKLKTKIVLRNHSQTSLKIAKVTSIALPINSTVWTCLIFRKVFLSSSKIIPKRKRSNSFVGCNSKLKQSSNIRKYSQFLVHDKILPFYLDKDDGFNQELLNEYNLNDDKHNDNDTDSAISLGGHSLSEMSAAVSDQVEFDSLSENQAVQCQPSPSTRSLEEIPTVQKTSNLSLDSLVPFQWKRNHSIFSYQSHFNQLEDFTTMDTNLGIMVIFHTIEEFDRSMKCLTQILESSDQSDYLEYDYLDSIGDMLRMKKIVVNVALCDQELIVKSDDDVVQILSNFCLKHLSYLRESNISRITFLLQSMDKSLRYFTFRKSTNFEEDIKVRQIDPALSFQLEINRLQNYNLERLPVLNRRMYVYLGKYKLPLATNVEYRMFVRCIIHHNDIHSSTTNVEFLAKEAEKSLLEAMDAIDIAQNDGRSSLTLANHIFFYFNSILSINKMEELESVVRSIVLKFGRRLWNLRITQAELKMSVKLENDFVNVIPIRLWVHNEGGKSLDIFIYKEEFVGNRDRKCLISWSSVREGRYHGLPVDCFYSI